MNRTRISVFLRAFRTNAVVITLLFLLLYLLAFLFLRLNLESNARNQQDNLLDYAVDTVNAARRSAKNSVDMVFGDSYTLDDLCTFMNQSTSDYTAWRLQNANLARQSHSRFRGKEGFIGDAFLANSSMKYLMLYGFSNYMLRVYDYDYAKGVSAERKLPRLDDNRFLEYQKLTTLLDQKLTDTGRFCLGQSFLLNNTLAAQDAAIMVMYCSDLEQPFTEGMERYNSFDSLLAVVQNGRYKVLTYDAQSGKTAYSTLTEANYHDRFGEGYRLQSRSLDEDVQIVSGIRSASIEKAALEQCGWVLLVVLPLLGCALASIWFFLSKSQRRMEILLDGIEHVKNGDLSFRVDCGRERDDIQLISLQFNQMCDQLLAYIRRTYEAQLQSKNAQLLALENQISPHFLYNTLEIIRMKAAEHGDARVETMIYCLVNLYRSIVKDETFIPLSREVDYVQSFIDLMRLAYGDADIEICIDMEPELSGCRTIKFILQPIAENFFVHGVNRSAVGNTLLILIYEEGGDIVIRIESIGNPISSETLREINELLAGDRSLHSRKYIGICNVHQRIRNVYGAPYGVRLELSEDGMPIYLLTIPKVDAEPPE